MIAGMAQPAEPRAARAMCLQQKRPDKDNNLAGAMSTVPFV
jgi:hypothetical protein